MSDTKVRTTGKQKKKKKVNKIGKLGIALRLVLFALLLTIVGVFAAFYLKYGKVILQMQASAKRIVWASDEDTFRQYQSSIFYDAKGRMITSLNAEREVYYVNYEDIPKEVIDSVITIEDKRYFSHEGVDLLANVRAAVALLKNNGHITQGGSTITQQLAKNVFLSNEKTIERKVKEIFIASELEKKYSKRQILEFYLNNIYFANGYYGIQAAANGYLGKSVSELTLSEAAFLCGIPNSPNRYNPFTNIENTYERRDRILNQMYEDQLIDEQELSKALEKKIKVKKQKKNTKTAIEGYLYHSAIEALMREEGFEFKTAFHNGDEKSEYEETYSELYSKYQSKLFTGGYRIYTTINMDLQNELQEAVDSNLQKYTSISKDGTYELQGSAVCIDNETGRVVALVGGRTHEESIGGINRAYQSYRQPGSSIKPIAVYAPYFEEGHNPDEIVIDQKEKDGPRNSNGVYSGEITIRTAVEQSKNTIAWKLFEELTPAKGLAYLHQMNFKKLCDQDEVLAASLGGLTYGTNTLEMAASYATIENDGVYRIPTCIERITSAKGEKITETVTESKQIYSINTARIMTDVLTGVFTRGTAKSLKLDSMMCAGKTGTTSDKKDGWFCGYTPYYTTAVWVGYDTPKELTVGGEISKQIWKKVMTDIHKGVEDVGFVQPDGVSKISVCKKSGLKTSVNCTSVITEYFKTETIPTRYCSVCKNQALVGVE